MQRLSTLNSVLSAIWPIARLNRTQRLSTGSSSFYTVCLSGFDRRAERCESVTVMAFYKDHIYPHIVKTLGDPKPIHDIRERLVPLAEGTVLEIGVGPGANFPLYHPARVNQGYALQPHPRMIPFAPPPRPPTQPPPQLLDL